MVGQPVYPVIGSLIDPHSGDELTIVHIQGTGPNARLEHMLITAYLDRIDDAQRFLLDNLYYSSMLFALYIRKGSSGSHAYRCMAEWLRAAGIITWGPLPCVRQWPPHHGGDSLRRELVLYAARCYARHRECADTCVWCGGFFARGDAAAAAAMDHTPFAHSIDRVDDGLPPLV